MLHPETKHGTAGAKARWDANENSAPAFTDDTAKSTGRSTRAVQIDAQRGKALGDDLAAIAKA